MKTSLITPTLKLLAYCTLGGTALIEATSSGGATAATQITMWTALGAATLKAAGTLAGEVAGGLFHDFLFGNKKSLMHSTIIEVAGEAIGRALTCIAADLLNSHPDHPGLETLDVFLKKQDIDQLQHRWLNLVTQQISPQLAILSNAQVESHLNDGALLRADELAQLVAGLTTDSKGSESYLDDETLQLIGFSLLQTLPMSFVDVLTDEHSGKVYRQRLHEMLNDLSLKVNRILAGVETLLSREALAATESAEFVVSKSPSIKITLPPPLTPQLFGRDDELQLLDNAWANPATNIVVFHALGGAGKSALVSKWLAQMAKRNYDGARRVFSWSFFSQGSSENRSDSSEAFIDSALEFFGVTVEGNYLRKADRLAEALRAECTLLVLDGIEPLQYPPNTAGLPEGGLKDRALQTVLLQLAAQQPGLCIITSRERLSDLNGYDKATVIQRPLDHLPYQTATGEQPCAQLLRALGVDGDDAEMLAAAQEFQGHAFGLTLLGSYVAEVLGGDLRRRKDIANLFDDDRFGSKADRMIAAYETWLGTGVEVTILHLLGLFDRPAEAASIAALRAAPAIAGLTETLQGLSEMKWQQALSRLRRLNLLSSINTGELDAHPLVREYFQQQLITHAPAAWQAGNLRLYEHLTHTAKEFPDTLAEMQPLFAAVMHGCSAGIYQDVYADVYLRRIRRGRSAFNLKVLGAFSSDLAALANFFSAPWEKPVDELDDLLKAAMLSNVGFRLYALGRTREAIQPLMDSLTMSISLESWIGASAAATNLNELFLTLGNIIKALDYGKRSIELTNKAIESHFESELLDLEIKFGLEIDRLEAQAALAGTLHQAGIFGEAKENFRQAEIKAKKLSFPLLYSLAGFLYCDFLLEQGRFDDVKKRGGKCSSLRINRRIFWIKLFVGYY